MLGLKRRTVALCPHEKAWAREAQNTILRLKAILGDAAADMQHVGSTAVPGIMAKPINDIAVATDNFNNVLALTDELQAGYLPAAVITTARETSRHILSTLSEAAARNGQTT